jgi:hypothetical protein
MLDCSLTVEPLALERAADHSHPLRASPSGRGWPRFIGVDEVTEVDEDAVVIGSRCRAGSPLPRDGLFQSSSPRAGVNPATSTLIKLCSDSCSRRRTP